MSLCLFSCADLALSQTIVAMGAMFVHFNPDVFPRPREFVPERWLESKGGLEKHLVAFSKGPRACIGMKCVLFPVSLVLVTHWRGAV